MFAVAEGPVQLGDGAFDVDQLQAGVQHVVPGDEDHVCFRQVGELLRLFQPGGIEHGGMKAGSLRRRAFVRLLDLDVVHFCLRINGQHVESD